MMMLTMTTFMAMMLTQCSAMDKVKVTLTQSSAGETDAERVARLEKAGTVPGITIDEVKKHNNSWDTMSRLIIQPVSSWRSYQSSYSETMSCSGETTVSTCPSDWEWGRQGAMRATHLTDFEDFEHFENFLNGAENTTITCDECDGKGNTEGKKCQKCSGTCKRTVDAIEDDLLDHADFCSMEQTIKKHKTTLNDEYAKELKELQRKKDNEEWNKKTWKQKRKICWDFFKTVVVPEVKEEYKKMKKEKIGALKKKYKEFKQDIKNIKKGWEEVKRKCKQIGLKAYVKECIGDIKREMKDEWNNAIEDIRDAYSKGRQMCTKENMRLCWKEAKKLAKEKFLEQKKAAKQFVEDAKKAAKKTKEAVKKAKEAVKEAAKEYAKKLSLAAIASWAKLKGKFSNEEETEQAGEATTTGTYTVQKCKKCNGKGKTGRTMCFSKCETCDGTKNVKVAFGFSREVHKLAMTGSKLTRRRLSEVDRLHHRIQQQTAYMESH